MFSSRVKKLLKYLSIRHSSNWLEPAAAAAASGARSFHIGAGLMAISIYSNNFIKQQTHVTSYSKRYAVSTLMPQNTV